MMWIVLYFLQMNSALISENVSGHVQVLPLPSKALHKHSKIYDTRMIYTTL